MDADDIEHGLSIFLLGFCFYVVISSLIAVIRWALHMAWILMMRLFTGNTVGMKLQRWFIPGIMYNSGHYYVGQFKEGEIHGIGSHIRTDGYAYHGGFKDGKQHGYGYAKMPSGSLYVGKWKDGEPVYEEGWAQWDASYMVRKGSLTFHYSNFWSYLDMIGCAIFVNSLRAHQERGGHLG